LTAAALARRGVRSQNRYVSSTSEWVSVDLLDDAAEQPAPPRPSRPRGWVGLIAAAVAVGLVGLVLWPDSRSEPPPQTDQAAPVEQPRPTDRRLLPWPGRGPWSGDEEFVDLATQVWQASVSEPGTGPGSDVHALWAGPAAGLSTALLQSVGPDGVTRVAQVSESPVPGSTNPGPLVLTSEQVVDREPPYLALTYSGGLDLLGVLDEPGSAVLQVLPAPSLVTDGVELQRQEGRRFQPVPLQADGLSQPWIYRPRNSPDGAVLTAVRVRGAEPGLLAAGRLSPGLLLPDDPPVQLVEPAWGALRRDLPEDYLDAYAALRSLDRLPGQASILGSAQTAQGRAALVEVGAGAGATQVLAVGSGQGRATVSTVSAARPSDDPGRVVVGAGRSVAGEVLVVATGPPGTTFIVLAVDGEVVATGPRTTAVWLERGSEPAEVAAQGYRDDETFVGRTTLDVSDL
jgi:hypothetical protein